MNNKFHLDQETIGLMQKMGLDMPRVLQTADLPVELLQRGSLNLETGDYFRLWRSMEQIFDDPLFPLRSVDVVMGEHFTAPCFAALCNQNLQQALLRLAEFKPLVGLLRLQLDEHPGYSTVNIRLLDPTHDLPWSLAIAELLYITQLARIGTGKHIVPSQVVITLPLAEHAAYRDFFGVEPELGDTPGIRFSQPDMQQPFVLRDDAMWSFFEPELRKRLSQLEADASFASRVRSALLELLPAGMSSTDAVAERLHVSKRTLQRRLQQEETYFQQQLDKTREGLAKYYLARTQLPNAQIAFLLGYEDPNSFYRVFQNWAGVTPETYRLQQI